MTTKQTHVRIKSLGKILNTIQNTMELLPGKEKDGAKIALNAVRKEYGLPMDGEQLTLFDTTPEKPKIKKKTKIKKVKSPEQQAEGNEISQEDIDLMNE